MATLTRNEVQSVERKLRRFAADLPEQERNVLGWLVSRARVADSSLAAESPPDEAGDHDLADALGFTNEMGDLTITWSKGGEAN